MAGAVVVNQGHTQLGGHVLDSLNVSPVRIDKLTLFVKFSAYNRRQQNGITSFGPGFFNVLFELVVERATRIGVSVWIGLLVVMTKLNQHIITWFDAFKHHVPASFVAKAQAAATIEGMIIHHDVTTVKIARKCLSPAPFKVFIGQRFVGTRRISDGENRDDMGAV
ncbi:MAG: hypothetical protein BWY72_02524 [Bacteroidetes bacterium ADurb.Bin416]|nr:MAG: hypothetical protein BWY72_02524 [Bacteroidetes bacterium ADurb.Bin416]